MTITLQPTLWTGKRWERYFVLVNGTRAKERYGRDAGPFRTESQARRWCRTNFPEAKIIEV